MRSQCGISDIEKDIQKYPDLLPKQVQAIETLDDILETIINDDWEKLVEAKPGCREG